MVAQHLHQQANHVLLDLAGHLLPSGQPSGRMIQVQLLWPSESISGSHQHLLELQRNDADLLPYTKAIRHVACSSKEDRSANAIQQT